MTLAIVVWLTVALVTAGLIAYGQWRHPERFTREAVERRWARLDQTTTNTERN